MRTQPQNPKIRPPAVAGRFYPRRPDELRAEVTGLLAEAPAGSEAPPKALIAPHAGYVYSGQVAAAAFGKLGNGGIRRVVVIGPAHYVYFQGIALAETEAFATPLGEIPLDREAIADLLSLPFVRHSAEAHAPEHSLEVELPFLQLRLGDFALVPLLVGAAEPEQVAAVLRSLWGGPDTLIVVSSDLSHFHPYEIARRLDAATAEAIEAGDWRALGPDRACGYLPIAGLLIVARERGLSARRLALCNSGDTAGSRDEVVGYGAWRFGDVGRA
jgi:AmmeMemoRadiSam system protein B